MKVRSLGMEFTMGQPTHSCSHLSEIAPSSLVWNTTGGGADLSYQISGSDLSEPTTIQLDWATGTTTDTIVGEPIDTITSGTTVGTYGPIHVDADTLGKVAPEDARAPASCRRP